VSEHQTITVLCVECGEVIEVKNVEALLLALHLTNACPSVGVVVRAE
jgi:hypothetical protein